MFGQQSARPYVHDLPCRYQCRRTAVAADNDLYADDGDTTPRPTGTEIIVVSIAQLLLLLRAVYRRRADLDVREVARGCSGRMDG